MTISQSYSQSKEDLQNLSVDHIPIAIVDLSTIEYILGDKLQFTIKEGSVHDGIRNCFIKFEDETYLEFVSPIDSLSPLGQLYSNRLKIDSIPYFLAFKIPSTEKIINILHQNSINILLDSTRFWKTISLEHYSIFFIKYNNSNWKEKATFTTHSNGSIGLKHIWLSSNKSNVDLNLLKNLGFFDKDYNKSNFWNTTIKLNSFPDSLLNNNVHIGFTITVKSLQNLIERDKSHLLKVTSKTSLVFSHESLPFFLEFVE